MIGNPKPEKLLSLSLSSILKKFQKSFLIFPQRVNFNSNDLLKTHQFYEFILVDTDSVKITHNIDRNNPQRIEFSKFQILRVML